MTKFYSVAVGGCYRFDSVKLTSVKSGIFHVEKQWQKHDHRIAIWTTTDKLFRSGPRD